MAQRACQSCGGYYVTAGPGRPPIRCPDCRGEGDDRHGQEHRNARAELLGTLVPGVTACTRCGQAVGADAQLDHRDDGEGYAGWAHPRCNARAGSVKAAQLRRQAAYGALVAEIRPTRPTRGRGRRGAAWRESQVRDDWPGHGCPVDELCPDLDGRLDGADCGRGHPVTEARPAGACPRLAAQSREW